MPDPEEDEDLEFADDEDDFERLVDNYFTEIYSDLSERGVPEDRMPTTLQVLSHVMESVDEARLKTWIEAYSNVEAPAKR